MKKHRQGGPRLLDVRADERRTVATMAGTLALMTAGHTLLETTRDTLFLSKLPTQYLALVYIALAFLSLLAGGASSFVSRRFGRRAGFVLTLGVSAFAIMLLHLRAPTTPVVVVLYLTSGVLGTILSLQYWLFAGQYLTVAQGKRLFGPIASGGVLGATLGAGAAALLLRSIPPMSVVLAGAALFLLAAFVVTTLPSAEGIDDADESPGRAFAWAADIKLLGQNRYVALVATLFAIAGAAVLFGDYLFKASAAATLGKERLGTFLGGYYAAINVVSLVVQLFLSSAIVRRLGLTSSLLVFPLLMLLSGGGAFVSSTFALALAVKSTDGSLRYSLHRVTSELLLLPLPSDLRDRSKRLFDTLVGRGTQAVAAIVIFGLSTVGLADGRVLAGLVVLLSAAWIAVALMLRTPYLDLFRKALARGDVAGGALELDLPAVQSLLDALSSADDGQVLAALDVFSSLGQTRLVPGLILHHESPAVLLRALGLFAEDRRTDFVPLAERLLGHRDPAVRGAAVRALAQNGKREAAALAFADEDPSVRASAAFFLAAGSELPEAEEQIAAVLAAEGDDGTRLRLGLLSVIGSRGDARWREVVRAIARRDGERPGFALGIAEAVRRTGDETQVELLIRRLEVREGRPLVREALVALGDAGFDALARALDDHDRPRTLRLQLPRALAAFGSQRAADLLLAFLGRELDPALQFKALRALGRLSNQAKRREIAPIRLDRAVVEESLTRSLETYFAVLDLQLGMTRGPGSESSSVAKEVLIELLGDKADHALERTFRFLQLAHKNEDIQRVHHAVIHGDKRTRATALEFLDALTIRSQSIREALRAVVDELPTAERIARAHVAFGRAPTALDYRAALARLLEDRDDLLAALAFQHAVGSGDIDVIEAARSAAERRPRLSRLLAEAPTPPLMMEPSHA